MTAHAPAPGSESLVRADFRVPRELRRNGFRLRPISQADNDVDYEAWYSSRDYISRTPDFATYGWPVEMTREDNRKDLAQHEVDFANRTGFTYSVFVEDELVGCVYIYPSGEPGVAAVRSWVREDHKQLDVALYEIVDHWVREEWRFPRFTYAPRDRQMQLADH